MRDRWMSFLLRRKIDDAAISITVINNASPLTLSPPSRQFPLRG